MIGVRSVSIVVICVVILVYSVGVVVSVGFDRVRVVRRDETVFRDAAIITKAVITNAVVDYETHDSLLCLQPHHAG